MTNMIINASKTYIEIINSYLYSKIDFDRCLDYIELNYDSDVFSTRSRNNLKREWAYYNLLYNLGILREYNSNVIFECHTSKFIIHLYSFFGSIAMFFIN